MRGLMMDVPLLIPSVLEHAALIHTDTEIVSRTHQGDLHRSTYGESLKRVYHRLANALEALGLKRGERVGTLAWNCWRHFELYFAVPGAGFVCHTINPRLFANQIEFIINDAQDQYLFVDPNFVPLVEGMAERLTGVKGYVILATREEMPTTSLPHALCYEELLEAQPEHFHWPDLDENDASGMCYTSGTTGNPKGVVYSHRSTVLHAMVSLQPDLFGFSAMDTVMPVAPMFHVNSWCMPYAMAMAGTKVVFPGGRMDGASLQELINGEEVTFSAGVPTVWLGLLNHADQTKASLAPLERVVIGGSACPQSVLTRLAEYGVRVLHAWGMTETSPLGAAALLTRRHRSLPDADKLRLRLKQGRPPFGVRMRIVDGAGQPLPWDAQAHGVLEVRGPWIANGYYNSDDRDNFSADGWFATGDVATMTPDGFMEIVDRAKDVIKSGGEWISSIALENTAIGHPAVREAAAIARPDPKWGERPRLVVALRDGCTLTAAEMRDWFESRVAKWWIPDDIVIVDELPHTATGKLLKLELRRLYGQEQAEGAERL